MGVMSFRDSMFLLAESRERPTHVGSLLLFDRPEGAGPDFLGDLHKQLVSSNQVARTFARRAVRSVGTLGQWAWEDDDLDIEYHVRLSALPRPGRIRELLELVSRLHGTLLDRHRPLWEFHLIEGVEGDRFAVYFKIHHAMMDGVTGMRHLQKALSTDAEARGMAPFWQVDPRSRRRPADQPPAPVAAPEQRSLLSSVGSALAGGWNTVSSAVTDTARTASQVLGVAPALVDALYDGLAHRDTTLPFEAPHSMFNVPITGARRFAAESWPLKRIQRVRERTDSTVNDIVLAMCSGALRRYMLDLDALPEKPLVAALPVSLGTSGEGNQLGAILVTLATDEPDAATRLERIKASGRAAKANLDQRDPMAIAALSMAVAAPLPLGSVPGVSSVINPGFNLIISNVPGPKAPLYWEGAKLDGMYPLSVPMDGQALNMTVFSYADNMEFGLTGDRRSVPRLQRLLTFLEEALVELEEAADGADPALED
ncbi:wax ester/triacylglycerol synthase family O-acyltransferase [Actinomycetospora endophytica]|uniref:Diacylglycerol O-acyltransferase n=1 Tax=Actinomycetospora endophytica TaxID=2291215 RepID=A0ABS8PJ92_9PSEU|nr:wax ester/triacylglycerol synthase family O-acyltransferase [Actinomycetospora endophytica]MCD2198229.1 wax ester/triacylglycerol synthase family O-acyltransferase [Actinomycetospora endophytica]